MSPAIAPIVEGIDPQTLALVMQFAGSSPVAVGLFFGLWVGSRAVAATLKIVLEAKADAAIRAVVGLTMAIKNATVQQPPPTQARPVTRRTGPHKPVQPQ